MYKRKDLLAWGLLLILSAIWGSSFILIKTALKVYTPGTVGAIRIVSAFIFMIPFAIISLKRREKKNWWFLFSVGMAGSLLPSFLFAIAQTRIPSSVAGVLNAVTPLFTLILGVLFFRNRSTMKTFLGVVLGFVGSAILIFAGSEGGIQFNSYGLLVVLATIFYATNLNLIKYKLAELSALTITSLSLSIAGPLALVYLLCFTPFTEKVGVVEGSYFSLLAVVVLGVLGTAIALILFNKLVKITSPIFTSSVTYIIPVVAVVWGLIDGERLYFGHYLGMVFIVLGVYFSNKIHQNRGGIT